MFHLNKVRHIEYEKVQNTAPYNGPNKLLYRIQKLTEKGEHWKNIHKALWWSLSTSSVFQ